MAQKKKAAKAKPRTGSKDSSKDLGEAVANAALGLAAEGGWRTVTPDTVAVRTGRALGDVLLFAPTRAHILGKLLDRLDAGSVGAVAKVDGADSARDRLFDVVMRRFDLLNRNREGSRAVIEGAAREPACMALVACRANRTAAALLGAAGISAEGLFGFLRVQGLNAVLGYGLRAWMSDDSPDMAKTMAAVDRALERAEQLSRFSFKRGRQTAETADI